ncbi:uncharacterized protein MONOS_9164 [Monocercomonoides exilis]|uniref:uncharacterized protein n=1 Tax=Monocercomonoides exilis TaxID=2049356 RepID=UPI003559E40D|nr:hypothetical protein MONOS_9164 [Monocercomonoides exilis]|eukprot:MONOS_9164.1-p1 / transcript=MONOS_9164.1 / gene=MONOS_9164 / organism=Monocercomonoides_exilis_PA203 / gene_product=unspecified product / transcript_product=unspecified product / location=Mono_scaffold00369:37843-38844(+) / protein_length=334 / sequence_SO=supercontig / SO=protein_coding / is_pseudo=false
MFNSLNLLELPKKGISLFSSDPTNRKKAHAGGPKAKLGMDELKHIVLDQQQEIRYIKDLMSEQSGKNYLKRNKLWKEGKDWSFDSIDHDNNPDTPDKIIWKTPNNDIYAVDGYTTGNECKRRKLIRNYIDKYPNLNDRRENKYVDYLKNLHKGQVDRMDIDFKKRVVAQILEKFQLSFNTSDEVRKLCENKKFTYSQHLTKINSVIYRQCLIHDMMMAINPNIGIYNMFIDKENVISKHRKYWKAFYSRLTDDDFDVLIKRYAPTTIQVAKMIFTSQNPLTNFVPLINTNPDLQNPFIEIFIKSNQGTSSSSASSSSLSSAISDKMDIEEEQF